MILVTVVCLRGLSDHPDHSGMGILMQRYAVDDDRAFAILRRYSQDTDAKLRDVARLLIDTRELPAAATTADSAVK
jgi:hypothetical protein